MLCLPELFGALVRARLRICDCFSRVEMGSNRPFKSLGRARPATSGVVSAKSRDARSGASVATDHNLSHKVLNKQQKQAVWNKLVALQSGIPG